MAFKVSLLSLFLVFVAKRPRAENARSGSTEVDLMVRRAWQGFSELSGLFLVASLFLSLLIF